MQAAPLKRKMDYSQQVNKREVEEIICLSDDEEDKPVIKIERDPGDDGAHSVYLKNEENIVPDSEHAQCVLHEDDAKNKHLYDAQSNNLNDEELMIKPDYDYENSESSSSDAEDDEHKMHFDEFHGSQMKTEDTIKNPIRSAFYKRCKDKTDRTQFLYMKFIKYYKEYKCEVLRMRIRRSAEKLAGMTKNSRELMLDSNRLTDQKLLHRIIPELLDPNESPNPFWN